MSELDNYTVLKDNSTAPKGADAERLTLRQSESKPIWDTIALWLEEVKLRTTNVILPKSDFGKAIQYIRNHFAELKLYLEEASLPIDKLTHVRS